MTAGQNKFVPSAIRSANARVPAVRPISLVSATLGATDTAFDVARTEVLRWLAKRAGRPLPDHAWRGESFELEEIGAQHTEAVSSVEPRFWAARLDDADKLVPSRTWVTEAALGEDNNGRVHFGAKLTAVFRNDDISFERSIPGFVRQISKRLRIEVDDRCVSETPWIISNSYDVDELISLICDPARARDVILVAMAEGSCEQSTVLVNLQEITRRTLGVAHVAAITGPASFYLSDRVGREFSVFRQAVRTYRPKFNPELDEPFAHPLALPRRILEKGNATAEQYTRALISQTIARSASVTDADQKVPSFLTVKRIVGQRRLDTARSGGSSASAMAELYEKDNDELRKQIKEEKANSDALLALAEEELSAAQNLAQQALETSKHLRSRIENLERQLASLPPKAVEIPDSLENVEEWCTENLSGAVEMHGRVYRGLKGSNYHDLTLIYSSLVLLRDFYVPMRRAGGQKLIDVFRRECDALGLEEEITGSETRAGEEGEEYYVRFAGRRVFLDRHLKKGNSRDSRHCFRLYFFWDDDSEQVVVGWLPSHLTSRIT